MTVSNTEIVQDLEAIQNAFLGKVGGLTKAETLDLFVNNENFVKPSRSLAKISMENVYTDISENDTLSYDILVTMLDVTINRFKIRNNLN